MNPFSPDPSYDEHLSDIMTRLGKTPVNPDALQDLLDYLPSIDLEADISVIKMRLKPLFQSTNSRTKTLTNQAVLGILQRTKAEYLRSIECEWIYHNFDATDGCAKAVLSGYFDVGRVAPEFFGRISWEDPIRDLSRFLFLVRRSGDEFWFDVDVLDFNANHVFDKIYEILQAVLRRRKAGEGPAACSSLSRSVARLALGGDESKFSVLLRDIFGRIKRVEDPLFVDRKYRILLSIYGYADERVYEESRHFSDRTLERLVKHGGRDRPLIETEDNVLCGGGIDYARLHAGSLGQIRMLIGLVHDREGLLLRHLRPGMNIFAVCAEFQISDSFVIRHHERLMPIINASIDGMYRRRRLGADPELREDGLTLSLLDLVSGRHKIILACVLGQRLNPIEFSRETIEEVFECSVAVFPREFFFAGAFSCSCLPLLRMYDCDISKTLPLYRNTRFEDVAFYIEDVAVLKQLILPGGVQESLQRFDLVRRKYAQAPGKNSDRLEQRFNVIWHVFYYKLRGRIDMPDIDFGLVFEHFLSREYILFLGRQPGNRRGLLRESVGYLRSMRISNTIYLTGYNFDDQKEFYYDLAAPAEDPAVRLLFDVYSGLAREAEEDIMLCLLQLVLYQDIEIRGRDRIAEYVASNGLKGADAPSAGTSPFDLGENSFIVERFLRQLHGQGFRADAETLSINRDKAVDVLLRHCDVDYRRLRGVNPTYLSLAGLSSLLGILQNQRESGAAEDERLEDYLNTSLPRRDFAITSDTYVGIMESDKNLLDTSLREARLRVYDRAIEQAAAEASNSLINSYSLSKLDGKSDSQAIFGLMTSVFEKTNHTFWLLLTRALHRTNNLYISLFMEDTVLRHLEGGKTRGGDTILGSVICISEYVRICTGEELSMLAFVFPMLYRCLGVERKVCVEGFVRAAVDRKIENSRIRFTGSSDAYTLKMEYVFDSVPYTATISIPTSFPFGSPRLDFDYKAAKCPKFFLKINELLKRSTKFVEIFMQWKVNLDNRFAGHKECLICYYVLEPKTRTFADHACENCRNKFHKRCIFEWIRTSKNTQCPLCRVEMDVWE